MSALDEARVRRFAAGQKVQNLNEFMSQIEVANLWEFARRPLDLDWLVQFWHAHGRLGTLAEMLPICISERLNEFNLDRARQDNLDVVRATHAVERIGAALVFGRQETIAVPDSNIDLAPGASSLDISDVLPDWSPQDCVKLLARAVFDPATLGRAQLHNDNQGVVRGYLAARWLNRLRKTNLSQTGLFDLLFARIYDIDVVKPSMKETAAWLALWDENVAREVMRRDPFLLLSTGDPASLSRQTREALLTQVTARIANAERVPVLDADSLKRFSQPDLAAAVRTLWGEHSSHKEVRRFLMRVVWLGEIKDVSDIVAKAALEPTLDRYTRIVAGRALMASGDEALRRQYSTFVKANCTTLPATVVWDALEKLFPANLSVADFLDILSRVDVTASDGGLGLDWRGPKLFERLKASVEAESMLVGLLAQLGGIVSPDQIPTKRDEVYLLLIAAAAHRVLELSPVEEAPLTTISALVRLGESARRSRSSRSTTRDLIEGFQKSASRRRLAFWGAAEHLAGHPLLHGRPVEFLWDIRMFGWSVELSPDDLEWLLADAPRRDADHERKLAINTSMAIWRTANSPDALRDRIGAVAKADAAMSAALDNWLNPPPGASERDGKLEELERRNALERARDDKSWVDFASKLRTQPAEMKNLQPTTEKGVDTKLYQLVASPQPRRR